MSLCSSAQRIIAGAERLELYLEILKSKNIAVVCNHSSVVGNNHLIDTLLSFNVQISKIFAPEHGFRGDADAGAHVQSGIDIKTRLPIISLYGKNKKPSKGNLKGIDWIVFDIQDVGVRFYTYISTLQYVLEAAAEEKISVLILDRPNPNGHYVDGPVLDMKFRSFVGMQPVPIVYGMTMGEYAKMLIGEKWLQTKSCPNLKIIPCENYTHDSKVDIIVPPSPNLKSNQAIALYPSLCLFEGTEVSVGRGTDLPFEVFGSPSIDSTVFNYSFIPTSKLGATQPPFLNQTCYGMNLSAVSSKSKLDLSYLLNAYLYWKGDKNKFFLSNLFFDKLAGNSALRWQIVNSKSEEEIRNSWRDGLKKFHKIRSNYLIYKNF